MIGQTLGSYRIVDKVGEGGMGAVYRAEHTLLGKRAAIKVLLPDLSRNPELVQRFFNEARAATAIHHAGIVEVFDFGHHTDGSAFIVMELLEGEPLSARLARGRLHPAQAMRLMRQAARALAAAHGRGIIHRDLKPDNIHVVPDPEVTGGERTKILDFGIAKLADGEHGLRTRTGAVIGTPVYMSPEQCRGTVVVDHRADLYALGVIFFEMLCGRPPFVSQGLGELFAEHMFNPPPPPRSLEPAIPPPLEALVLQLLAKDPAARPQRAEDLVAALDHLEGVAGPAPTAAPPQPVAARPPSGPVSPYGATHPSPAPLPPASPSPSPAPSYPPPPPPLQSYPPRKKVNLWLAVGLPVGAGLLLIGIVVFMVVRSKNKFEGYMRKAKTTEVKLEFNELRKSAQAYQVEYGAYPNGHAGPTPPLGDCCSNGGKCPPISSQWRGAGSEAWEMLDFEIDMPQYYSYEYTGTPESYTVRAYGDLDCDGTYSTFETSSYSAAVMKVKPNE